MSNSITFKVYSDLSKNLLAKSRSLSVVDPYLTTLQLLAHIRQRYHLFATEAFEWLFLQHSQHSYHVSKALLKELLDYPTGTLIRKNAFPSYFPPRFYSSRISKGNPRLLLYSSKFNDFVSSQEVIRNLLKPLCNLIDVYLVPAPGSLISNYYLTNFTVLELSELNLPTLQKVIDKYEVNILYDMTSSLPNWASNLENVLVVDILGGMPTKAYNLDCQLWPAYLSNLTSHSVNPLILPGNAFSMPSSSSLRNIPDIKPLGSDITEIRLGAFCRLSKLSVKTLDYWIMILKLISKSTLTFAYIQSNKQSNSYIIEYFAQNGIDPCRLSFLPRVPTNDLLLYYNHLDLVLGSFPEQGGVSTFDALIMGCPYILYNNESSTLTSYHILKNLKLDWMISDDLNGYISTIQHIASSPHIYRDKNYRLSIRSQLLRSTYATGEIWSTYIAQALTQLIQDYTTKKQYPSLFNVI